LVGFARFNGCAALRLRSRTAPMTGSCLPLHADPGAIDHLPQPIQTGED
jgi:hypothetical protein